MMTIFCLWLLSTFAGTTLALSFIDFHRERKLRRMHR